MALSLLILASLSLTGCKSDYRLAEITDVSAKETLLLKHKNSRSKIYKIEININGSINGDAILYQKDNHSFVKPIELKKGDLSVSLLDEWYSTSCILEYEPGESTEGEINIKYKFYKF